MDSLEMFSEYDLMKRSEWPWWVRISLFGVSTRKAAMIWGIASLLIGIAAAFYFQKVIWLFFSLGLIFYAVPARWVDKNSRWK